MLRPDSRILERAEAVSMAVRQQIERSTDLRRIFTLSLAGILPFSEVELESGEDVAERQSGRETGRQSLPFAMGIAGGVGTWGILECVRFLYRKRK